MKQLHTFYIYSVCLTNVLLEVDAPFNENVSDVIVNIYNLINVDVYPLFCKTNLF